MEKLAAELLTAIFTLSCLDGGLTASSLSLVCKHFREVAHSLRFHSVILSGTPDNLSQFLAQLEDEHIAYEGKPVPKVRHLFLRTVYISPREEIPPEECATCSGARHGAQCSTMQNSEAGRARDSLTADQYDALVTSVLRAVAPTLETLAFFPTTPASEPQPRDITAGIVFPTLRELTLFSTRPPFKDWCPNLNPPGGDRLFPSLARLHLFRDMVGKDDWGYHAPNLSHLRISDLSFDAYFPDLARVYGPESGERFESLETGIIGLASPPPIDAFIGQLLSQYEGMVYDIWEEQAMARIPVYTFPPQYKEATGHVQADECYSQHIGEWLNRLEGRIGCWATLEEYARRAHLDDKPPSHLAEWWGAAARRA